MIMFTGPLPPKGKSSSMLVHYGYLPDKVVVLWREIFGLYVLFEFIYLFIPRFLPEHLTTVCINLVEKHWVFDMGFVP